MVARRDAARESPYAASRLVLALMGCKEPTIDQEAGAMLVAEFGVRVIQFLSSAKK